MNGVDISIEGMEEVNRKLQALSKDKARAAIRKGTRAGANIVKAKIQSVMPVRSGAAKRAITVRAIKRSRKYIGTRVRLGRPPGAKILYIAVVNYGSKKRNIRPRRFLNREADALKNEAVNESIKVIAAELEKHAARP